VHQQQRRCGKFRVDRGGQMQRDDGKGKQSHNNNDDNAAFLQKKIVVGFRGFGDFLWLDYRGCCDDDDDNIRGE
jgi:hypothetical protein